MNGRRLFWLLALLLLTTVSAFAAYGLWRLPESIAADARTSFVTYAVVGLFFFSVLVTGLWVLFDRLVWLPLRALSRGARIISHSHPGHRLEIPTGHLLGELPPAVEALGEALHRAQHEARAAMATGARAAEAQQHQLEAVLRELSEGVLVCDANARIVLYNPAAMSLLNDDKLGLGRSLYELWVRAPLDSTLSLLRQRQQNAASDDRPSAEISADFVCATLDGGTWIHCRMRLVAATSALSSAFVITFTDAFERIGAGPQPALYTSFEQLRQPLSSLRAAAEMTVAADELAPEQQRALQKIVVDESSALSRRLDELSGELRDLSVRQWPLHDVLSTDLLSYLSQQSESSSIRLLAVGDPLWLHVDSHSLLQLLGFLIGQLGAVNDRLQVECLLGDQSAYVDLIWPGEPLPASLIESWAAQPLTGLLGAATVADVLQRHDSELWSQAHRRSGKAILRLPLPVSERQWRPTPVTSVLPQRPEFYDFSIGRDVQDLGELAERPLAELDYVVFDTETTGLEPSRGDEVIQIAGVRVINRRVLRGETFDRLVNPGRGIPAASIRFHGISDNDVKGEPRIDAVLPEFKRFVGPDSTVLVAHNAAFDMKFLRLKQDVSGVRFDNPVLDTLLLSAFLHDHAHDHNLDTIAERLGLAAVQNRHNALGDALATAEVFTRLLTLLAAQNISTLGEALTASEKMVALRRAQARF